MKVSARIPEIEGSASLPFLRGSEKGEGIRDKIQNWLMGEGWQIAEPTHQDFSWLIRAEDGGERRILVGQHKTREDRVHLEASVRLSDEHRNMFESLPEEQRREILWNLRFRLLQINVDFVGVAEPIQDVILTQRIYLDGLTKDAFIQRFITLRNAVIAVIWSTIKDLQAITPPAKSTEMTKH